MTIAEMLLPEFDQEMTNTRKMLERVPENKFEWTPHPKSMPLGRLAGHVAEMPAWVVSTIRLDNLDLTPPGGGGPQPYVARSQKELLETFDKNVSEAKELIAGATDEHLHKIWYLQYQGKVVISMPRAAVIRSMVMNHMIHHRAQLGVYLRLNDVAIPGMYGPSADEGRMFAAQ